MDTIKSPEVLREAFKSQMAQELGEDAEKAWGEYIIDKGQYLLPYKGKGLDQALDDLLNDMKETFGLLNEAGEEFLAKTKSEVMPKVKSVIETLQVKE